jgi:hypothetical protein
VEGIIFAPLEVSWAEAAVWLTVILGRLSRRSILRIGRKLSLREAWHATT